MYRRGQAAAATVPTGRQTEINTGEETATVNSPVTMATSNQEGTPAGNETVRGLNVEEALTVEDDDSGDSNIDQSDHKIPARTAATKKPAASRTRATKKVEANPKKPAEEALTVEDGDSDSDSDSDSDRSNHEIPARTAATKKPAARATKKVGASPKKHGAGSPRRSTRGK